MNERIKELAERCRTHYYDGNGGYIEQFDEEKFAELIVRECFEQIIIRERANGEWYQDDVLKHFGVEE